MTNSSKMLSTHSASSIQNRRKTHRRQQSLEVPILATPLPANHRRNLAGPTGPHGHRRGLSLDQRLSAVSSPTGFRPILPQDQDHILPESSPVRIKIEDTNQGQTPQPQHFVQETQSQSSAQPGYNPAHDFSTHLQQQLLGNVGQQSIAAPTPTYPHQQQALQQLQHHIEWYQQSFRASANPPQAQLPFNNVAQPMQPGQMAATVQMQRMPMQPVSQTPIAHGQSQTVPNTPQQYTQSWPSPPATTGKHVRSQSYQLDVAPMPIAANVNECMMPTNSPYTQPQLSFSQDQSSFGADEQYASSNYSSSLVDPMSPGPQQSTGPMPTLFEEPTMHMSTQHGGLAEDALLLEATAGASDDFHSPAYMMGGMSPHTAALHNLGEGVNCSIIETGISADMVNVYIHDTGDGGANKYICMFLLENGKRCDKNFGRHENASSHVQNHLGDRKFQCNECSKTFVRAHDMKRHAAIHQPDRPHLCPCGQGFARHDALTRHRQRGMCSGTLPGFEKAEEDKPKRGRPKKHRPDQKTRTDKAKKARAMDAESAGESSTQTLINYASSSSVISEHSLPMTPPDAGDLDADAFFNLDEVTSDNVHLNSVINWNDTPPTSPVSSSPVKAFDSANTITPALLSNRSSPASNLPSQNVSFEGCSSPITGNAMGADFNYGGIDAQPDVAQQDLFSEAFSPSHYAGSDHSSPFGGDYDYQPVEHAVSIKHKGYELEPDQVRYDAATYQNIETYLLDFLGSPTESM